VEFAVLELWCYFLDSAVLIIIGGEKGGHRDPFNVVLVGEYFYVLSDYFPHNCFGFVVIKVVVY
jgi:hypothetical protein